MVAAGDSATVSTEAAAGLYAILQALQQQQASGGGSLPLTVAPSSTHATPTDLSESPVMDNASSSGGSAYNGELSTPPQRRGQGGNLMTPRPADPEVLQALQAFLAASGGSASHTMALLSNTPGLLPGLTLAPPSPATRLMPAPPIPHNRPSSNPYQPVPTRSGRMPQPVDPTIAERDTVLFNDFFDWPSSDEEDEDFNPSAAPFEGDLFGDIMVGSGTEGMAGTGEGDGTETDFSLLDETYLDSLQKTLEATPYPADNLFPNTAASTSDPFASPYPHIDPSLSLTTPASKGKSRATSKQPKASTSTSTVLPSRPRSSRKRAQTSSVSPPSNSASLAPLTNNDIPVDIAVATPPAALSSPARPPLPPANDPPSPTADSQPKLRRGKRELKSFLTKEQKIARRRQQNAEVAARARKKKKMAAEYNEHRVAELEDENLELREKLAHFERVLKENGLLEKAVEEEVVDSEDDSSDEEEDESNIATSPAFEPEIAQVEEEDVKPLKILEAMGVKEQGLGELEKLMQWAAQVEKAGKNLKQH